MGLLNTRTSVGHCHSEGQVGKGQGPCMLSGWVLLLRRLVLVLFLLDSVQAFVVVIPAD